MNDALPGRVQLGLRATEAIASGQLTLLSPCAVERINRSSKGLMVTGLHGVVKLAISRRTCIAVRLARGATIRNAEALAAKTSPTVSPPLIRSWQINTQHLQTSDASNVGLVDSPGFAGLRCAA